MNSSFLPLYMKIANDLRMQIHTEKIKPGDKLPTEYEIMQIYNVSRITASKAVSILAEEGLIYRARKLGTFVKDYNKDDIIFSHVDTINTNQKRMFPLVFPFSMNNGLNIVDGILKSDNTNQYYFVPYNSDNSVENEREILTNLLSLNPPGLICNPIVSKKNIPLFMQFKARKIPLIFIDHGVYGVDAPCVTTDNHAISYNLTSKLIAMGHTKIASVCTNGTLDTVKARFTGMVKALIENNIIPQEEFFIEIKHKHKNSAHDLLLSDDPEDFDLPAILKTLMSSENRPTALICTNDAIAIHIEKLALASGISVPKDLSIIGFDNTELCNHMVVPLTSIAQNYEQLGAEAISIFNRITVKSPVPSITRVPAKIVWRDSVRNFTNYDVDSYL